MKPSKILRIFTVSAVFLLICSCVSKSQNQRVQNIASIIESSPAESAPIDAASPVEEAITSTEETEVIYVEEAAAESATEEPVEMIQTLEAAPIEETVSLSLTPEAYSIPAFPWPPPMASGMVVIPENFFSKKGEDSLQLTDVNTWLNNTLDSSGHFGRSYFSAPGGYAMATRLEQINPDGSPKPGIERWSSEVDHNKPFSLKSYFRALFMSDPGFFRIIVFIVSPYPFSQDDEGMSQEYANGIIQKGSNTLPYEIGLQPYTKKHTSTALIYEFEKLEGEQVASNIAPGRLPGRTHLEKSNLWQKPR